MGSWIWTPQLLDYNQANQKEFHGKVPPTIFPLDFLSKNFEQTYVFSKAIFTLSRNETGFKLADSLSEVLSAIFTDWNEGTAMYCALVMTHLFLRKQETCMTLQTIEPIKCRYIIVRKKRLTLCFLKQNLYSNLWVKLKQNGLLTLKISTAIQSLTEAKGGVLFLTDKIGRKTVLDLSTNFFFWF